MQRSDFTYAHNLKGYMLYYKGKPIGGAGTMQKAKHRQHKRKDLAMYKESAEREIDHLLSGRGQARFLKVIGEIEGR